MTIPRSLLEDFLQEYPFQPATAFWRAIEIGHVIEFPFPTGRGLDLGCGDGKLTKLLLERVGSRDLAGLDMDAAEIRLAGDSSLYRCLYAASATHIPESDSTFDFIFANSVLEHIKEVESVCREAWRVLKPQGIFLFTVPSHEFEHCLRGPLLPWVSRERYLEELNRRMAHFRYWSKHEWESFLAQLGFSCHQVTSYFSQKQVRRFETIARLTSGILYKAFGGQKHPIEIQRSMGLRKVRARLPSWFARVLASVLMAGLAPEAASGQPYGGIMIRAKKH